MTANSSDDISTTDMIEAIRRLNSLLQSPKFQEKKARLRAKFLKRIALGESIYDEDAARIVATELDIPLDIALAGLRMGLGKSFADTPPAGNA